MKLPPKPTNEADRLQDLYEQGLLNSEGDPDFDMLVELASRICDTPISTISLIDSDRQWFKAKVGIQETETERSISFCAHTILQNDLLVVNDATQDDRFAGNPLVTGDEGIRFYAGAQIVSAKGNKLGTLCVIDTKPRELNWHQASALRILSNQASRLLELRRLKKEKEQKPLPADNADLTRIIALFVDQLRNSSAVLERSLDPLKTGKFTKKQLSLSYAEAAQILRRNERLGQGLKLLGAMENPDAPRPVEEIFLVPLFETIDSELAGELKKKPNKALLHFSPMLSINQYRPYIYGVLKGLFHFIYSQTREDVSVSAMKKEKFLEIRLSLIYSNLSAPLRRHDNEAIFLQALEEESPGDNLLAHDLFLLRIILQKTGGSWEVSPLGSEGTQVLVVFPIA